MAVVAQPSPCSVSTFCRLVTGRDKWHPFFFGSPPESPWQLSTGCMAGQTWVGGKGCCPAQIMAGVMAAPGCRGGGAGRQGPLLWDCADAKAALLLLQLLALLSPGSYNCSCSCCRRHSPTFR